MENFTITLNNKDFDFKKTQYEYYQITPFEENINIVELSNTLIKQKGYYISGFGSYNPIEIDDVNEYGEKIHPFNIRERCFFAKIEASKKNKIKEQYKNFLNDIEEQQ